MKSLCLGVFFGPEWGGSFSSQMAHDNESSCKSSVATNHMDLSWNDCKLVLFKPKGPFLKANFMRGQSQKGRKGAGVKGAGVANCRIFRSAVPSVVVWSISPCFPVWGEEKVMTIYDAGPVAAGPLCGLLTKVPQSPKPRKIQTKKQLKSDSGGRPESNEKQRKNSSKETNKK